MLGRKSLNSLQAGLTKQSDLNEAFHEFQILNPDVPKDLSKIKEHVKPKPSKSQRNQKVILRFNITESKGGRPRIINFSALFAKKILI